jgi:serine/threonine protein phosphatase PrpC
MEIKILQLHKRASYEFKFIQDKWAINSKNQTIALADGTTQSFNSEYWAEIITKEFVTNPTFSSSQLIEAFSKQVEKFNNAEFNFSSSPAVASLEKAKKKKGGTATFLGIQFFNENLIKVISCGDSNLFLIRSKQEIYPFPFPTVDSLDANNYFINSEQLLQGNIDDSYFQKTSIKYEPSDILILATDALSRLILKEPSIINEVIKTSNFDEMFKFCLKNWESKDLQEDDISAIIISFNDKTDTKLIQPSEEFSFPREVEDVFKPNISESKDPKIYTDTEMNEIRDQFNGVAQDFDTVKKKLKLHEMLLIVVISLLLANTMLIYTERTSNSSDGLTQKASEGVVIDSKTDSITHSDSEKQSRGK